MNYKFKKSSFCTSFCVLFFCKVSVAEEKKLKSLLDKDFNEGQVSEGQSNLLNSKNSESLLDKEKALKKIELENALNRALLEQRLTKEFANDKLEIEKLKMVKELFLLKYEIEKEQCRRSHQELLTKIKDEKELIQSEIELAQVKMLRELGEFNQKNIELQKKLYKLNLEDDLMKITLESEKNRKEASKFAISDSEVRYTEKPFTKDGKMIISDRKIELNGVISPWKANYIEKALSFYNNKSTKYPIFLVIEYSVGGYVSAGDRIIRAMQSSKAPVYVVLKSFAASMAAVIVTVAEHSYAYPNARILHHQPHISGYFDKLNVREAKEEARRLEEVYKRLLGPVAKKMGISLDELDRKFYENSVNGDWMEYADDAKKLKWVNELIFTIDDNSVDYMPNPDDDTLKKYSEEFYRYGFEDSSVEFGKNNCEDTSKDSFMYFDYNYVYKSSISSRV